MTDRLYGEIDIYAWLSVNVEASHGTREIKFLVDTGFDGALAVPISFTALFGTSPNSLEVDFADGARESSMIVQCRIKWLEGYREVTAIYINGSNPLIGMELLENCLVTLELGNDQRELTIESL